MPVMRFERKRLNPCHIVVQIEYKKDLKNKKRKFNLIDENCAQMINFGLVKCLEVLIGKYESEYYLNKV